MLLWFKGKLISPWKCWNTQFLQVVQGFTEMASDLQRKISQFSKEINWLKEGTSEYEEFVLAEIERISKNRAACDRKMNLDKQKKSFGEIEWKKNPTKKIELE